MRRKACEKQNASLVSINTDLEWTLLTRMPHHEGKEFIELYNIKEVVLFYIGLVTLVGEKHEKVVYIQSCNYLDDITTSSELDQFG